MGNSQRKRVSKFFWMMPFKIGLFCTGLIVHTFSATSAYSQDRPLVEISSMFSYGKSDLGNGAFSRQNRYSFSVGLRFTQVSAIEVSYLTSRIKNFTPSILETFVAGSVDQTVTYDDQVYSASWVQNFVSSKFMVQPYFKVGAGRFIRKQKVSYTGVLADDGSEIVQESVTGVAGLGLRIFLLKNMALKGELVSYMPKFRLSTWKDSQLFTAGLSWLF